MDGVRPVKHGVSQLGDGAVRLPHLPRTSRARLGAFSRPTTGQVIHQLPGKPVIMKNSSTSARLKFILFQVGPEGRR